MFYHFLEVNMTVVPYALLRLDMITLQTDNLTIYTLFDDIEAIEKQRKIDKTLDTIRDKYGFLSVQNGSMLMEGSRVKERSKLVGGHAGGIDGII